MLVQSTSSSRPSWRRKILKISCVAKTECFVLVLVLVLESKALYYLSEHNSNIPPCFLAQFHGLTKCSNKLDCLIDEMLSTRKLTKTLNVKTDSIRAKVFTSRIFFLSFTMLIRWDYSNQIFATFTHFALRMVSWWLSTLIFPCLCFKKLF